MTNAPTKALKAMKALRRRCCRDRAKVELMKPLRTAGRIGLALSLLIVLSGCESDLIPPTVRNVQPLSCEIFTQARWQEFNFGVDSPADVVDKAVDLWGIEQEQIQFSGMYYGGDLGWTSRLSGRDVSYFVWFDEEGRLEIIRAYWRKPFATLSQVIECLGPPDLYSARYEFDNETRLDLELWYVEEGFAFSHYSYPRRRTDPPISPVQRIDGFDVSAPLPLSYAFPDLYAAGVDPVQSANALCLIKPWPGSIEAIEVTRYDEEYRCLIPARMFW